MNRIAIVALACTATFASEIPSAHAQGQWAFGDASLNDRGDRIDATLDGDLLVCDSNVLTRIDGATTTLEWRRRVEDFYPLDVIEAADGRVVAAGLHVDDQGGLHAAIMFFDGAGNHLDQRIYPGASAYESYELIQTADGGFLLACETLAPSGSMAPLLIRTDGVGDDLWIHRYDMPDHPFGVGEFCDVEEILEGDRSVFHLTGRFQTDSLARSDTLMAVVDDLGAPVIAAHLGFSSFSDFGRGLRVVSDGYVVTGYSKQLNEGGGTYLMHLDWNFGVSWYRGIEAFAGNKAMDITSTGLVRLPGYSSFPDPVRDAAIVEIDLSAPNSASGLRYGDVGSEKALDFVPDGGGYALIGETWSFGTPQADHYLVRTDSALGSDCIEALYEPQVIPGQIIRQDLKLTAVALERPIQSELTPRGIRWFEEIVCDDSEPIGPCTDPPIEMTSWWTMDELAGTTAADSISGLDGVHVSGPMIVSGMVENALDFDGADDHVRVPGDPLLQIDTAGVVTGDLTIDAWIRIDATTSGGLHPIVASNGSCQGYAFYVRDGRLEAAFSDGPLQARWTSSNPVVIGEWLHVAVACDRGLPNESCRFYIDGVEEVGVLPFPFTPTLGALDGGSLLIGRMEPFCSVGNSQPEHFNGVIDEVEYFRRALDASEIQAIHAAGEGGKCKVTCNPPWDRPFCIDDAFIDVTIPVCNASQVDADVQISFSGLNPPTCGGIAGPTVFTLLTPNPVIVAAGGCVNVVVRIDRPVGMTALNQVGCYEMQLQNLVDGRVSSGRGSVQDRRDLCPIGPPDPIEVSVGETQEIGFPFINTGFDGEIVEWRAVVYAPDMTFSDAFILDDGAPGSSLVGQLQTSVGEEGLITFSLRATRFVSGECDVVIFTRAGRAWIPLASRGLRMEPGVFYCPSDLNGDLLVNGGDLGLILGDWGACSGCPTDLNGDGLVGGADLGVFLADWGDCSR